MSTFKVVFLLKLSFIIVPNVNFRSSVLPDPNKSVSQSGERHSGYYFLLVHPPTFVLEDYRRAGESLFSPFPTKSTGERFTSGKFYIKALLFDVTTLGPRFQQPLSVFAWFGSSGRQTNRKFCLSASLNPSPEHLP